MVAPEPPDDVPNLEGTQDPRDGQPAPAEPIWLELRRARAARRTAAAARETASADDTTGSPADTPDVPASDRAPHERERAAAGEDAAGATDFTDVHGEGRPPLVVLDLPGGCEALTSRQHAVLWLYANGYSVRHIARAFGVQRTTVHSHLSEAQRRLRGRTRMHALFLAFRHGLLYLL